MDTASRNALNSLGLLILRVGAGGFMLTHGWGKLQMVIARDFDKFADPIGLGKPASLLMVTFAEFLCAALVVLGLATRLASLPIVFAMGVAAFIVHEADPWTMSEAAKLFFEGKSDFPKNKQPALMFMAMFGTLVFTGGGRFSLDSIVWRSKSSAPKE